MDTETAIKSYRASIQKFATFNEDEWNVFTQYLSIKKLKKKAFFAEEGKVCTEMAFIVAGSVRYCNIIDGEEITGYFSFEHNFIAALKSYLTQTPSLYYIQALEPTLLICIRKTDMDEMFNNPLLGHKMERFSRLIAENFITLYEDRLKSFIINTPEERYMQLLQTGKDVIRRIPQHYIAQYIGITPVSLSRIRSRITAQ